MKYFDWLPADAAHIVFVLFLSFLIGLEREERKASNERFAFGGVRTYPLIGLLGYAIAALSGGNLLAQMLGFAVLAGFLMMAYWHKLTSSGYSGVTSEMSGLTTYLMGALVYREMFWLATALTVSSILLLELKAQLENLAKRIEATDILTFATFLLLSAVILPLLPNEQLTQFQINPFKTWLVVVAVSAVSYGSYVLQRVTKGQGGLLLSALVGGAYSSTVTTVVLARRSRQDEQAHLYSGGVLIASGVMYLRVAVLLALFNHDLMDLLALPFVALGCVAMLIGWLWSRRGDEGTARDMAPFEPKNPLEISAALLFALLFVGMLVATQLVSRHLGVAGVYTLATLMGVIDVDPFIMGMTQSASTITPLPVAGTAIIVAAASNNMVKGIYAFVLSSRKAGMESMCFLFGLAACGLLLLFFLR
ncbi:MgtC/SapB family protein [Metapseudomonas boanensis]|uniref:MgtC/SapB family protein n=1 Tax=Metapseudomonas boanensis TaxID=2822138 RepID=A0ABS5XMX3_9GAMM|nr:MgtC/SapB family protein [Pseudomonas boanensis]MBT8768471.1 MgtC/SapB family protein [Pseudomonas boanensis]